METEWLESLRDLKLEYRKTLRTLQAALETSGEDDRAIIEGMISDVNLAIEWLHTGRRPGNKRGIERRAGYQREKLMDPLLMQSFVANSTAGSPSNITDWQRTQIADALIHLTDREKECYILKHGQCLTYQEIADMLGIARGAVESYVERAQKKISKELEMSLFLVG